ncbi:hypothetical protein JAAARDRAFT_42115 [Jaapia argillacea MUCL 33604]|uniref:Uncharacterized protein n=1 Tax=Jaapia argillacea MUCL 33604 TaxID=933084 RepID=A0A067P9I5_9AGAM|nr:hypothetical protein JAAARDRAFT_42115 [Jaapia argillacea MUCL 33604]
MLATLEVERGDIKATKPPAAPLAAGSRVVGRLGVPSNSKNLVYKLSRRPGVYGDDHDDDEDDECDDDLVMFVG